jgi:hypothetical protein
VGEGARLDCGLVSCHESGTARQTHEVTRRVRELKELFRRCYSSSVISHSKPRVISYLTASCAPRGQLLAHYPTMWVAIPVQHHDILAKAIPQNSCAGISPVPIHRLPVELLVETFLLSIECHGHPPLELFGICRYWRTIILGMPKIWADIRLSTWTQPAGVLRRLKLTGTSLLNVEIDTAADRNEVKRVRRFWGLSKAAREANRWRNLTITSFPPKGEIDVCSLPQYPAFEFVGPMDALESLKIKNPCESSIVFDHLLDVLGSSSHSKLTYMELMSLNAVNRLSQPQFVSIFRPLITFKVDVRDMSSEADILPHFERLEILEACGLCLPHYPADQDLPVVRTLKHIKLKGLATTNRRLTPGDISSNLYQPYLPRTQTLSTFLCNPPAAYLCSSG